MVEHYDIPLEPNNLVVGFPEKQAAIAWPVPVDARLERLLLQAREAGERTSRKELVAALVSAATLSNSQLRRLLRTYRTARAGDILPDLASGRVVTFKRQRPGPRRTSD